MVTGIDATAVSNQRNDILQLIEEQPGLDVREISRETKFSRGAVVYHIRKLGDQVVTVRQGRYRLHFIASTPDLQRRAIALLRIWSVRHVVEEAIRDEFIKPTALAEAKGISLRSVRRSIRMLVNAGLAHERPGRFTQGSRHLLLHPATRIAWSVWCRGAEQDHMLTPLHQAPGWFFLLDLSFSWLFHDRTTI